MGKKLNALTSTLTENPLALSVKDSAQQVWLAGLGAYAVAEEEGGKVLEALVKEGEIVQARVLKQTDEKIAVLAGKAATTWDRLEHVFDDGMARTLSRLGVPSKRDINKLSKSVVELSAVVHELAEGTLSQRQHSHTEAPPPFAGH